MPAGLLPNVMQTMRRSAVSTSRRLVQPRCTCQFSTSRPAFRVADDFVDILGSDSAAKGALVQSLSGSSFTLSDGLVLPSPIILLNGVAFMWDVSPPNHSTNAWQGWDPEQLKVFEKVTPRPEILFVGTGPKAMLAPPKFRQYLNSLGIQVDVQDSKNACATYNLLLEEGRRVAAALYPIDPTDARTGRKL